MSTILPIRLDFERSGGKNVVMIGTRYDFGCAKNDVAGQRGSPAIYQYKGNAESWCCSYGWTNKHTREMNFLHDGTATFAFSPKLLRMYFSDQFVIEL